MKPSLVHKRIRSARLVQLIEVEVAEGAGTQDDPVRVVRYYYDGDGKAKAKFDTLMDDPVVRVPVGREEG